MLLIQDFERNIIRPLLCCKLPLLRYKSVSILKVHINILQPRANSCTGKAGASQMRACDGLQSNFSSALGGAEAVEINRRHNCFGCKESWSFLLQEFSMWSNIFAQSGNCLARRLWWMQIRWVGLIELLSLKWNMTKLTWSALYPECAGNTYLSATWMGKSWFCRWYRCKHSGGRVWPKKLWFCISQIKGMCELYLCWPKGVNKLS